MPLGIRITTSDLHRAFEQLDRFPEEKCRKFVKAAQGGFLLRSGIQIALAILFHLIAGGIIAGGVAIFLGVGGTFEERMYSGAQRQWLNFGILAGTGLSLLTAGLATLFARDLWLRSRIRYVLDMRGRCSKCHYGLLGLPISDSFEVKCPECGETTKVDASLATLLGEGGESGTRRLVSADAIDGSLQQTFWTTQRRRFVAKVVKRGIIGIGVCIGLVIVSAIAWELFIRVQASRAKAMRTGVAPIQALTESKQPVPYSADQEAWAELVKAIELKNGVDRDIKGEAMEWPTFTMAVKAVPGLEPEFDPRTGEFKTPRPDGTVDQSQSLEPEFKFVVHAPSTGDAFVDAYNKACGEFAKTVIEKYEEAGVFEILRRLPARRWAVKTLQLNGDDPAFSVLLPELGGSRAFARINAGRMDLAIQAGDVDKAIDVFEEMMAIQRCVRQQALLVCRDVSIAIEALAMQRVPQVASIANPDQLARLEAILHEQESTLTLSDVIEGEKLMGVDVIAWAFSDPKRTRFGKYSPALEDLGVSSRFNLGGRHLGFVNENVEGIVDYYDKMAKISSMPGTIRTANLPKLPANLVLPDFVVGSVPLIMKREDMRLQTRAAAEITIAAYQYKAEKAAFPDSRNILESFLGREFPVDPLTERPLQLRKLDAAKDPFGRPFFVYSFGPDGVDNDGVEAPRTTDGFLPSFDNTPSGSDFILFDPADR